MTQTRSRALFYMTQTARHAGRTTPPDAPQIQGVRITHADRVIDTRTGLTKLDLVKYYAYVAPALLPFLRARPVYLLRAPQGLAGAAQMGAIELHVAGARADLFDRPDSLVLDLDPDPALPWSAVVEGAQSAKALLDMLGLQGFVKTSGGKGLHIAVPLARRLTQAMPSLFSATMGEQNRVCKIYVDYLRNRKDASTAAPYSARAARVAGVGAAGMGRIAGHHRRGNVDNRQPARAAGIAAARSVARVLLAQADAHRAHEKGNRRRKKMRPGCCLPGLIASCISIKNHLSAMIFPFALKLR